MNIYQSSFNQLFSRGSYENLLYLSDSSLRTEDGSVFKVHRIILARENRFFRDMFCGMGRDKRDFTIPGIRGEMLDLVLTHIYNGTVHLTELNACELIVASDYLQVDSLTSRIKKYLRLICLSLDNCISIYMTALKIKDDDIERRGYRYIQTHFGAIVNHETFGDISFDAMKRFLADKNLCVRSERAAWFAIVKWVEHDASNRLRYVSDLIQCLMVSDMDECLTYQIFFSDIVANNQFCKDLNEMKMEEFNNGLDMFVEYRLRLSTATPYLHSGRRPECLHLIAKPVAGLAELYLTYDENLDLWRKIGHTNFSFSHLMVIDYDVYMFDPFYSSSGIAINLIEKQYRSINTPTPRVLYELVSVKNMLYVIGGTSPHLGSVGGELLVVEYYNPHLNKWFQASAMFPSILPSAAVLQDSIFVIGESEIDDQMIAQVYNVETDSWTVLPAPNVHRCAYALTVYHEKMYIIGGRNRFKPMLESVEVFDLDQNKWQSITDLPYEYDFPTAVVYNDKLVVFDQNNPPVFWNEADTDWKALDTFLSLKLKDLKKYLFCTIHDSEKISKILRENRDPAIQFEMSPFA